MSQPAVSNALNRLRLHFDDRLFVRSDRGVRPTTLARNMAVPISEALAKLNAGLRVDGEFDVEASERTFRLILHDYSIPSVLPPLLKAFDKPTSKCGLQILTPEWTKPHAGLANGEADLMLDVYPHETDGLKFEPIAMASPVCVVRENHPSIGKTISLEEFSQVGHAVLEREVQARLQMASMLMAAGVTRRQVCVLPNASDLAATVATSDLLALVPKRYGELVAPIYRLRVLPPPFKFPNLPIFLGWQADRESDPAIQWMRETIRSIFQDEPE